MDMVSMGIQIARDQAVRDEEAYQALEAKRMEKRKDLVWNLAAKPAFIVGGFGILWGLIQLGMFLSSMWPDNAVFTQQIVGLFVSIVLVWVIAIIGGVLHIGASFCSLHGEDDENPYNREFWLKRINKPKKMNKYKELKATREKRLADIALYERYMNDPDFRRAYQEVMGD